MKSRAEHMAWCKERALAINAQGDQAGAIASMLSDLGKHPETEDIPSGPLGQMALFELMNPSPDGVKRYIEGFG